MTTSSRDYEQLSLYVGSRIEHESERAVLQRVVELLARDRRPAVILANANLGDRQIDLVVCLNYLVLVIEAKGIRRPIRGSENGPWQVQVASGEWKDSPSPYLQAREAALKVRDAIRSFERREIPYPTAAVVFVPAIPRGSQAHPGDFKVSVLGLEGLGSVLCKRQKDALPLHRWQAFAKHLRLTPVPTAAAACDPALFAAEDLLRQYHTAFRRANAGSESLVPFTCRYDGRTISTEEVTRMVPEERAGVLIRGPSGCGKTLLASQVGLASAESGAVVITIPARDYAGSIKAVMDREVGLLIRSKTANVLNAARALNRPLLFVVDGYNECGASESASLTRGLVALARHYEGSVLVTSQIPLVGGDQLALREIDVPPTDMETKAAIARNVLDSDALPDSLEDLLEAVTTGLEAKLIGEVGRELNPGSSRHALFDAFARKRLGDDEREGIRLLSLIAGRLCHRVAFSMSRRDLDRLTDEFGNPEPVAVRVRQAGLLIQRADRVHFAHELFFDAFAAEAVVRAAAGGPTPVIEALAHPQHASRKALILGAIDDDLLLDQVLERLEDPVSVASCLSGACGRKAQEWAEARAEEMWERLRSEALAVSFRGSGEDWINYGFEKATLTKRTCSERAFLDAMRQRILDGHYLDDVLDIVGILDQRIVREEARLRQAGKKNRVILNALFSKSYALQSDSMPGITQICAQLHGRIHRTTSDSVIRTFERTTNDGSLSAGQMYLLLNLTRGARIGASTIVRAIESHWAEAPYHLQLDLMDAVVMCYDLDDKDRAALILAINALPTPKHWDISSAMLEALQRLGALVDHESEYYSVVHEGIRECLSDPDDDNRCAVAYGLYTAQFEHPYEGAYCEVIAELPDGDRKILLTMAARGAPDTSFWLPVLLNDLASFCDSELGDSFVRWIVVPPTVSLWRQDAISAFVVSHVALARLCVPLPDRSATHRDTAKALAACGEILYWCNRHDLDESAKRHQYGPPLRELQRIPYAALDVVRQCEGAGNHIQRMPGAGPVVGSIVTMFPVEALEICRHVLSNTVSQVGYFWDSHGSEQQGNCKFAIDVLARYGTSIDLRTLRGYADNKGLGTAAVGAVRAIEERLASS